MGIRRCVSICRNSALHREPTAKRLGVEQRHLTDNQWQQRARSAAMVMCTCYLTTRPARDASIFRRACSACVCVVVLIQPHAGVSLVISCAACRKDQRRRFLDFALDIEHSNCEFVETQIQTPSTWYTPGCPGGLNLGFINDVTELADSNGVRTIVTQTAYVQSRVFAATIRGLLRCRLLMRGVFGGWLAGLILLVTAPCTACSIRDGDSRASIHGNASACSDNLRRLFERPPVHRHRDCCVCRKHLVTAQARLRCR